MAALSVHTPRVVALFERGYTERAVAVATGLSPSWVRMLRLRWQAATAPETPDEPVDGWEAARAVALARGKKVALAKVAAGEWVLPSGEGVGG